MADVNKHSAQHDLSKRKVALLATNGFEQSELSSPLEALKAAGAQVSIVSIPKSPDTIRGWSDGDWSKETVKVDGTVPDTQADDFDALVLPGGVINPDQLRVNERRGVVRARLLRCGEAGGGDLSRSMDDRRGRRRERAPHDVVSVDSHRRRERGCDVDRRGGGRRPGTRDESQSEGSRRLQSEDGRRDR